MVKKEGDKTTNSSKVVAGDKAISPKDKLAAKKQELELLIKKAEYYAAKSSVVDIDLYYIVKDFFKVFLDLNYEFSFDELLAELDKIYLDARQRENVSNFILKIKLIEYDDRSFDKEEIKGYIKEFSGIARILLKNIESEKETFWTKLQKALGGKKKSAVVNFEPAKEIEIAESKEMPPNDISGENSMPDAEKIEKNAQAYSAFNSSDYVSAKTSDAQDYLKKNIEKDYSKDAFLSKTDQEAVLNNKLRYSAISSDNTKYVAYIPKNGVGKQQEYKSKKDEGLKLESWDAEVVSSKKYKSDAGSEDTSWIKPIDEIPDELAGDKKTTSAVKEAKQAKIVVKSKNKGKDAKTEPVQKQKEAKQTSKSKQSKSEEELCKLIEKAKKSSKKSELSELYKKINSKYDSSDVDVQAKYYKELVNIYNKISKLK